MSSDILRYVQDPNCLYNDASYIADAKKEFDDLKNKEEDAVVRRRKSWKVFIASPRFVDPKPQYDSKREPRPAITPTYPLYRNPFCKG